MSETEQAGPEWKRLADTLRDTVKDAERLTDVPIACARVAFNSLSSEGPEKRRAIGLVRDWVNYARDERIAGDDPFAIRYHTARFAEQRFGQEYALSRVCEVDLGDVTSEGGTYEEVIGEYVDPMILRDEGVAVIGGAARIALKMYAGMNVEHELPINDVDAVLSTSAEVATKAEEYGIDLAGAKIVDGNMCSRLERLITNFDCTMNQAIVYNGKLLFTKQAFEDIREGNIRLIAKNDPLFGSGGYILPDGNVYLNRSGFYRGLSFLLRSKGKRLIVSEENLEREKGTIGRYWLILLLVKIMPMKDVEARKEAIGHWHNMAQRLGATRSAGPQEFYEELITNYPGTNSLNTKNGTYNAEAQARWVVGKLTSRAAEDVFGGVERPDLPETFTPGSLELAEEIADYDYVSFERAFNTRKS